MREFYDPSATAIGAFLCLVWVAFLFGWIIHRSHVVSDAVQWFRRMSKPMRFIAAFALLGLVAFGGSKSTNAPNNMLSIPMSLLNTGSLTVPDWYVYRGYPQTDSDGDGIPDAWERWTRTNSNVDDALLDPDNDGVSNFEEYLYQCDPIRADTDGDGLNDRMEIDGLVAEVEDMDPLAPATYQVTEPDTNNDGIPDLWGDPMDYIVYTDWDDDGYCDDLEYDYEQLTNSVGVVFHVTSSRSCVLSTGVGYPLFLPACTNFAVRARISTDSDTEVRLYAAPDDTYIRSTWKARLEAEWEDDGYCEIENDRIRTEDGVILDMSTTCIDFAGALVGDAPLRGVAEPVEATNSTGMWFWRKTITLSGTPFCSIHGPTPTITATCTGVEPPLHWEVTGTAISEDGGVVFTPENAIGYTGDYMEIVCSKLDVHTNVILQTKVRYAPAHCEPGETNIVGACWYSTHDPEDASDHAPGVTTTTEQFGPNCPLATNVTATIGFTHNALILHTRNLVRILSENIEHDNTDHCIGLVWAEDFSVNLNGFLDDTSRVFSSRLCFRANGLLVENGLLNYHGGEPSLFSPAVIHIVVENVDTGQVLDRCWMTIYSQKTKRMFDYWFEEESSDLSWTDGLPPPFESIASGTSSPDNVVIVDPEPNGSIWNPPEEVTLSNYIHHNAAYEMRSAPIAGGHGHQATYDSNGILIRSPIAAGTADKVSPVSIWNESTSDHRDIDVLPFISALQMDGNPAEATNMTGLFSESIPTRLTKPCLYYGEHLQKNIQCRPILPTGTQP